MSQSGYDINVLFQEAQARWLKPAEVLYILQNHDKYQLTQEPPQKPTSGSLFLFNKRVLRFFRKDGHNWRKKKDGRTVGEAHERLKVGNVEALNCYYAHGEQNSNFQRRSYWMLDSAYEHIVLVHYREIGEGKSTPGPAAQLSPGFSSSFSPSQTSYTTQNPDSTSAITDKYDPYRNSSSPSSIEVSSEMVTKENGLDATTEFTSYRKDEVSQYLRRLEEQLSLTEDSIKEIDPLCSEERATDNTELLEYEKQIPKEDNSANLLFRPEYFVNNQSYGGHAGMQLQTNNLVHLQDAGDSGKYDQSYLDKYADGNNESVSWNEVLDPSKASSGAEYQEKPQPSLRGPAEEHEYSGWLNFNGTNARNSSLLLHQEVENFEIPAYAPVIGSHETNPDYYSMLYDPGQLGVPIEADSSLTVAQQQKFIIWEISPDWGFTSEATKVIVVGSFLCDPSQSAWTCMFGDTEVPTEIIQEGVLRCQAPPHLPGKVTFCITSGNRESCSEVREFEYRAKSSCPHCSLSKTEVAKSPEELLLLVRFVQFLLSDPSLQKEDSIETGIQLMRKLKTGDDSWGSIIEALLVGNGTSTGTVDWLLQQLLKDKLQQWLSSKFQERQDQPSCTLSKKEQGIIHMVAGLGFEWALSPILSHGVSIDFRDINGWTALHWAARFGREKMVAALIALGASAGAVTDPTSQDPIGKTPASIAANSGHKGLAGYLSEVALTSHLSSLTIEESELSKGSAEVEAERTVDAISKGSFAVSEDQVSLKDTLAAVRNAAQAAARIQSAFRAHSFRKRQEREAATSAYSIDEYGVNSSDIQGLSAMSKLAFRNARDYNSAALSIQKKYRGWKGRKDFLAFRQKVVKIQAHVRGYQVRKHYKVICWAVGILDKVVLRWRRKGAGLRGFRNEAEPNDNDDESEDEDILKVFRKQKVDVAIGESVSRVLSMVDSPEARLQYHRMLERYRQAKFMEVTRSHIIKLLATLFICQIPSSSI
ncbi:calmodulin-binding transcription activator 4 isoform X2 [Manihot esculenta]|uniref:calmodulin-binding transcription activator 4 isoform X2 n=1 Tax=Manihot esculenta TaxID=3983 RepID=UPI001CC6FED5|nr:calmodulin-binding transcription activator 4 isoform X2 [Manihot esculenta]